jgi:hypothetical protein
MMSPCIKSTRTRFLYALLLFQITGPAGHAADNTSGAQTNVPGRELLEFIAEFSEADDETFELVFFFGQQDAKNAQHSFKQEMEETNNEHP